MQFLEMDLSASSGEKGEQGPYTGPGGPSGKMWGAVRPRHRMVAVAKESIGKLEYGYSVGLPNCMRGSAEGGRIQNATRLLILDFKCLSPKPKHAWHAVFRAETPKDSPSSKSFKDNI